MIKRINEAQIVNTTKESEVKKAIAYGLFDGIGDYVQSSLINKKELCGSMAISIGCFHI